VSVLTTGYARAGFTTVLKPPRPGIYYPSVAIFNALTQVFTAQNGVSQDTLPVQTAQLYAVASTGSPLNLQPQPRFYPYGSYLGPIQAVWYEPTDSPGTYPLTLGALTGLIQWTPPVTLDPVNTVYLVPGTSISAIVVENTSDTTETITVTGLQSGLVVGSGALAGNANVQIALEGGTGDTVFGVTSSGTITATLALIVGTPPEVNHGGGGGGTVYYASLTGDGEVDSPGDLTQVGDLAVQGNVTIDGGLSVDDAAGAGVNIVSTGAYLYLTTSGGVVGIQLTSDFEVFLNATGTGQVVLHGVGGVVIGHGTDPLAFFGAAPVVQGSIAGMLSAVTDPNAKTVLASIVNQLDRLNLILNNTT
jgi:hypothetical protein